MSTVDPSAEIAAKLRAVREQIRKRIESPAPPPPPLPPLPLESLRQSQAEAHARADAIGTVNPRTPGLANGIIQSGKQALARLLDWHVRPQREFNRAVMASLETFSEVMDAASRNLQALAASLEEFRRSQQQLAQTMESLGEHWSGQILQVSLAQQTQKREMESSMQQRLAEEIASAKDLRSEQIKQQRWTYEGELARHATAVENRFRELAESLQGQTEALRLVRQRLAAQQRPGTAAGAGSVAPLSPGAARTTRPASVDYFQFESRFRGSEAEIRARQSFYMSFFRGRSNVLDIACGRGEFLEVLRQEGVPAHGVDLDGDMVACCLEKQLDVVQADVFEYLETVPDGSLDGIFCAQFIEHLEADACVRLITACAQKLAPAGLLVMETQNPECLAIFSQSFYLDPTHVRPVPPGLLRFLYAEAGLIRITAHFLAPAAAQLPLLPKLESRVLEPEKLAAWNAAAARFNETFFGGMDYAVIGYRAESRER